MRFGLPHSQLHDKNPKPVKKLGKIMLWIVFLFFGSTILAVLLYRWVPVPYTTLMGIRSIAMKQEGRPVVCEHKWVPLEDISAHLPVAVMASEDQLFLEHHGFDFDAIEKAMEEAERGGRRRGASTISQQTAKNVFLWPSSTWIRKGFEAYFTFLIELFWPKERIMEVYLNVIEMGDGIYGAEAVAQQHFGCHAKDMTREQCALVAATLPNPRRFSSKSPSSYMRKRQRQILTQMQHVAKYWSDRDRCIKEKPITKRREQQKERTEKNKKRR
ncbi:MAG: monofunctional biosynthetic peptidoglycan transglycosylase [Bacteroidales bacterium]|nr:monofunctional biosynthetic peptidoglycan transglycosylase [Candidatus Physcousia equi]